ncbi:hypothetical protein Tco_1517743 [Tanacetum coccineum]
MGNTDDPSVVKADLKDWFKKPERPHTLDPEWNEDFSAFVINRLQISDLTQDILIGLAYKILKGTWRIYVELEYNMEECYKALTDQLDWNNPEGDRYPFDLSKPLPLVKSGNRQIVLVDYFFNNDLAYLQGGSTDRTYTAFLTLTKAVKYDLPGIKDMVPNLWSPIKVAYDKHALLGTSHWGPKRQKDSTDMLLRGYPNMMCTPPKEFLQCQMSNLTYGMVMVILRRFKFEDLISNCEDIVHLAVALRIFTRRIIIQKRVEDLQLGVESYQKKLNISKPRTREEDLSRRAPYTTLSDPQGFIYEDKLNKKRLMRSDELYKFSDGTLQSVRDTLHDMATNLIMGYNKAMPKRRWCHLDKTRSHIMVKEIDPQLRERRLMRSLEKFVGGRHYGEDLRLLQRTI